MVGQKAFPTIEKGEATLKVWILVAVARSVPQKGPKISVLTQILVTQNSWNMPKNEKATKKKKKCGTNPTTKAKML